MVSKVPFVSGLSSLNSTVRIRVGKTLRFSTNRNLMQKGSSMNCKRIRLFSQIVAQFENLILRRVSIRSNRRERDLRCAAFERLEARLVLAATPLLPDLTSWADQSKGFMYDWTVVGSDLRLTTAMANIGTGPLELRGGATQGTSQEVYQRLYASDGTFTNVLAGAFTYHPEHGHIHFDGFAQFRLRAVLSDGGDRKSVV